MVGLAGSSQCQISLMCFEINSFLFDTVVKHHYHFEVSDQKMKQNK